MHSNNILELIQFMWCCPEDSFRLLSLSLFVTSLVKLIPAYNYPEA